MNNGIPNSTQKDDAIAQREFRDAAACLYGLTQVCPRIARILMKKIIGIDRTLSIVERERIDASRNTTLRSEMTGAKHKHEHAAY